MPWTAPSFPVKPRDIARVRVVQRAVLSEVHIGPLRVVGHPNRWITGAVYDRQGRLVRISQKTGGLGGHPVAPADPANLGRRRRVDRLRGRWLYGGHWMMHFGHFLTETITTLWPEHTAPVAGLVFHRYRDPHAAVASWQQRLVDLAGYVGLPIRIVADRPVRVDELIVPSRSVVQHGWGHEGARAVWRRVATALPDAPTPWAGGLWPSKVFASRTSFNETLRIGGGKSPRSTREEDVLLDEVFAEAGFAVVAPESLSIDDQVRLVRGVRVLAGQAGSALHLAGLTRSGAGVIELGDSRTARQGVPTQRVVDTLSGHREAFLSHELGRPELVEALHELGVWQSGGVAVAGQGD